MTIVKDFQYEIRKDIVFKAIDCHVNSPIYDKVVADFSILTKELASCINPLGVYTFVEDKELLLPGMEQYPVLYYCYITLGAEVSHKINEYFHADEYLSGLLLDAMADDLLFQYSAQLHLRILSEAKNRGWGLSHQYSPGDENFPMEYQVRIVDVLNRKETIPAQISLTDSYMLKPVKSLTFICGAGDKVVTATLGHDCKNCNKTSCAFRAEDKLVNITVSVNGQTKILQAHTSENILKLLREHKIVANSVCGGNGVCGKCKIQFLQGGNRISSGDIKYISQTELDKGYRLACTAYPEDGSEIVVSNYDSLIYDIAVADQRKSTKLDTKIIFLPLCLDSASVHTCTSITELINNQANQKLTYPLKILKVLSRYLDKGIALSEKLHITIKEDTVIAVSVEKEPVYGIAIDIGTTTLAFSLIDLETGNLTDNYSMINSQVQFGADVISRIQYTMDSDENLWNLGYMVIEDIKSSIHKLLENNQVQQENIHEIVVAGNTTMIQFLLGLPSKALSIAPFMMVTDGFLRFTYQEVFRDDYLDCTVYFFPAVAAYVGGDIVSGMLFTKMHVSPKINILIDIGTNGEMVIGSKDRLLCAATAAGPAFEGARTADGIASVAGAISVVKIVCNEVAYQTIGDGEPNGICGTGIIDAISEMYKNGLINKTGRMNSEIINKQGKYQIAESNTGKSIGVTQQDIREIQLAKSAIRAGLETLICAYGCTYEDIDNVYLAGGFGGKIDVESASMLGLIPVELKARVIPIGNASVQGCIDLLLDKSKLDDVSIIMENTDYIELSSNTIFNQLFIDHMFFSDKENL